MPWSVDEGKDWTVERIVALQPRSILDIGPGSGTYAKLLRPLLPDTYFSCIEVFAPYVDRFGLKDLYDRVTIADATEVVWPFADVIILGDVLEHVDHDVALWMWRYAREGSGAGVFLSLPIYGYEQGPCEGNDHEAHLHQWSDEQVRVELPGIVDGRCWSTVGTYQAVPSD